MCFRQIFSITCCAVVMVFPNLSRAQLSEPLYVIDHPTAGLLQNGGYHFQGRLGPESSILLGLRVGFRNFLQVGASFGMQRVFERGSVDVNDRVGFRVRVRLFEETESPALAVGFDSQGQGFYHGDLERYDRKSPGFYGVLSKNYALGAGFFSIHGGVNYSLEREDDDDPNLFAAAEWELVESFAILLDADAALNDNNEGSGFGEGGIYLDAALRVTYGESLSMMLIFRDLTGNFEGSDRVGREFEIGFVDTF
ncbi:MAG: hypothetical protein GTO51_04130 [Candidatus Latescibacteria bacterium]|nr:hypothetical protein [Candidatus Latescibacterota bacterium]NIM21028.1 hypothetical protein [Candidatus Latescibacterota bacterium]NIM65163.1 hypothetical protein [Candidatus Latescibacterota bacterium]NIO01678.1 hypothetical protein [Candidatus Latescibacterota bacterium]NIO28195.1 hypothetical protein [Candidatus Latescibacterota bacterium]